MADLLGLITGGLTATNNALNARDEGMAERRKAARDDLLARIQQEREDADATVRRDYMSAQTRTMNAPKPPRTQFDSTRGGVVDLDTNTFTPTQGLPQQGRPTGRSGGRSGGGTGGGTPATPGAPAYEERAESGGVAIYENGRFKTWKIRPQQETSAPGAGSGGATGEPGQTTTDLSKVQDQQRGLRNMTSALDRFEATVNEYGAAFAPGPQRAAQQAAYTTLLMEMKNLFALGVLAGPDLTLLQDVLNDPASLRLQATALTGADPKDILLAQVREIRAKIQSNAQNMSAQGSQGAGVTTSTGRTFQRVP